MDLPEPSPRKREVREIGEGATTASPAAQQVIQYLSEFKDVPSLRLAKLLRARYPMLYKSVEQARSMVRFYRGNAGERNRAWAANSELHRPSGDPRDGNGSIAMRLPEPMVRFDEWATVDYEGSTALVLSDIHAPFHDRHALEGALQYALDYETKHDTPIDSIILNGDIIDFYAISRWETDPRMRNLGKEIESVRQLLFLLRDLWPTQNIYYKCGNHEDRWRIYMQKKAPELFGLLDFEMSEILGFEDLDIIEVDSKNYGKFGDLPILHGHEFGDAVFSPVNPARGFWLRAKESMLGSHHHKSSSHNERTLGDSEVTTYSIGCLCDLHPAYRPVNSWNHGFAILTRGEDEHVDVENKRIRIIPQVTGPPIIKVTSA